MTRVRTYVARFTEEAAARVRKLHPEVKKHIRAGIDRIRGSPFDGHPLQDDLAGLRSLRVGGHRVVYRVQETSRTLDIILVGPRRDIYEELRDRVLRDIEPTP